MLGFITPKIAKSDISCFEPTCRALIPKNCDCYHDSVAGRMLCVGCGDALVDASKRTLSRFGKNDE